MNFNKFINSDYLKNNPLCGIDTYKDELNLATGGCTRNIKKLVLTGQENWLKNDTGNPNNYLYYLSGFPGNKTCVCSHLEDMGTLSTGKIGVFNANGVLYINFGSAVMTAQTSGNTVAGLKEYLSSQYAADTPVMVWYVLATPTTETITVPSGLSGTEEGYLIQDGTPTPTNPIYPTANTVEKWFDLNHYIMGTSTDTITTLPAVLYPNDTTATVGLKGNMQQSGTPTPSAPIYPQECGERTAQLIPEIVQGGVSTADGSFSQSSNRVRTKYIPVESGKTYAISSGNQYLATGCYYNNGVFSSKIDEVEAVATSATFTVPENVNQIAIGFRTANGTTNITPSDLQNYMLNEGSTPFPYEPYGQYKIQISSNSTTTPVYLGEVQTTRKIKKLVLDGTENWLSEEGNGRYSLSNITTLVQFANQLCTHFQLATSYSDFYYNDLKFGISNRPSLLIHYNACQTVSAFKAFLAAEYEAGHPVTVWYVLPTPQTAVVNEPLRKISTYADEVSGITVPVTAGANTLSVDTTLQPSEVTVNYKGWHPVVDVHVYPDSSWMPTSWEEFRKAVRSGKAQSLYPVGTKLYENWGDETSDAWIVVDYPTGEDYLDSDLAQQGYTNRVMLMEEKLNYLRQFDAIEAWLYVETAIPAGAYRFTIPNYDASYGGNKTYIFTSTVNVPVSGQLTLTWAYQQNPSAVQAYSSATSTSTLFNVSITEWDGTTACTDLGTIKLAQNDPDSTYGKLNHIHRARYSSNNYYQSGYRQWLNTNASANWWTPTNVFDRPYGNRTNAGRLNVMNSNMKSVLATPTVNCITNNLFEYPSLDGTTFSLQTAYTVKDKLFPVTHSEINLSASPNVNSVLDYYVGKGNADRIKYRKDNGNDYYWWLRTPYPATASGVRFVLTSGALSSTNAINTNGSAAACIIQ